MSRMIDLSMEMFDGLGTGTGGPKMAIMNRITHDWSAPRYLPPARGGCDRIMMLNEHIGTHVDAPFHFLKEGATIDKVDLNRFWGTAVLIDASKRDHTVPVSLAQVKGELEAAGETVSQDDIVIIRTWAGNRSDPNFTNAAGFSVDIAHWAVDTGLKAIGIDLPSVDSPGDRSFPVHMALVEAGIPIIENLINLTAIAASRFTFFGLPWRLVGGSGCPIRAVALVE